MQIILQQVSPVFLETEKISQSMIWNRELSFSKEEKIQLIAPSGSGKTSFIHFLYGLRKDYKGNILFNNKNIAGFDAEEIARYRSSHLSIVFQDLRLFADHTAYENIHIKKILNPFCTEDSIFEMAERLGISNKLNQPAGICSYGEQQRIAIIRALQQPFDFLILDEPFSHLDENNSKKAMALIEEEVEKRNAGIILSDLEQVEFFKEDRTLRL
ncbi:MAG: ATP-binding cassette domain-containing protein [Ferruginibacter sp.]|jgi:putative ABC transport system ATP-binding protein